MCKPLASIINTLLQCSGGDIRITIGLEITGAADVHQKERERERERERESLWQWWWWW